MAVTELATWTPVCQVADLTPDRGVAVLVEDHPVAVFHLAATPTSSAGVYAVDHCDPVSGAAVMARGLVGSRGSSTYVTSPLHKERYCLDTGECLDRDDLRLAVWPVRIDQDMVLLGRRPCLISGDGDAAEATRSST